MNNKFFFTIICLFTSVFHLCAAPKYFEYSDLTKLAYRKVFSLQFEEAQNLLNKAKSSEPGNLTIYHIENYIDFLTVYINEDEAEFERLKKNKHVRLDKIKQGDPSSPYFLYTQAEIRLHWALAKLKFGEYFSAFQEVNRAHKLLEKNQKIFPDFIPNLKNLGALHALMGTIPDNFKWGIELFSSLEGSIEQGTREIEKALEFGEKNDYIFQKETVLIYSLLLLHLKNETDAVWSTIDQYDFKPAENLLDCFFLANISMRTGRNEQAIEYLTARPRSHTFQSFPYLDFMLGMAKLRRLDRDANIYFRKYIKEFKGKFFIKEAYQKLAWHALLQEDEVLYKKYMQDCLVHGFSDSGEDKSALREAKEGKIPNLLLLRSRLLFDGAYYQKATTLLNGKSVEHFLTKKDQLEFLYRQGRNYHGLKEYDHAQHYYSLALQLGKDEDYHFACNAALQSALIFENLGKDENAIKYFNICLDLKPKAYRTSLHQKAKAGLNRLKK